MEGVHGHAADIIHVIDAIAVNGVNGALAPLLKRLMLMAMHADGHAADVIDRSGPSMPSLMWWICS